MDKIRILLESLPDTADDIASYFKLQGISGIKCQSFKCPISNFLRTNGIVASVGSCTVAEGTSTLRESFINLPRACSDFVNNFDAGLYPDLEVDEQPDETE